MIECNFSCPQMAEEGMGSDVGASTDLISSFHKSNGFRHRPAGHGEDDAEHRTDGGTPP